MNVLKGTLRLSIVAALIAAGYVSYADYGNFLREQASHHELVTVLKCGAKLSAEQLASFKNAAGNIDIGKAGCADRQFWATESEMQDAWSGQLDLGRDVYQPIIVSNIFEMAIITFVLTNLLGVAFLGLRFVYRWVAAGFKTAK